MDKEQLNDIMERARAIGNSQASGAIQKCKLFAPLVNDSHALSYIASGLDASPTIVRKWARAGAVLASEIFPEEGPYSIDFYAEVYEWPPEQWETVADLADWAELNGSKLKGLRAFAEKMQAAEQHWCPVCNHRRREHGEWVSPTTPTEYESGE